MIQGVVRDTFERNPGLCELFKAKMRQKARRVGLSEDWLDFESYLDMKGTYSENLALFYWQYPQLAEQPTRLQTPEPNPRQNECSWRSYQRNNGIEPEPTPTQVIMVTGNGSETTEPEAVSNSEFSGIPTLKFEFTSQTVSTIRDSPTGPRPEPETVPDAASKRLEAGLHEATQFLVVGRKKSGKTALAFHLLDRHHEAGRKCFWYQHPQPQLLPAWITSITDMAELPPDGVCVIDEAPLHGFNQFSYRKPETTQLGDMLEIARQNGQSIIVISQSSPKLNRDLIFPVDVYLLKEPSPFQRLEERQLLKDAYSEIHGHIAVNEYYWLDGEIFEKTTFAKPSWFTVELSEAYRNYRPPEVEHASRRLLPKIRVNYGETAPTLKFETPEPEEAMEPAERLFDPEGLALSVFVGAVGFLAALRGGWSLAVPLLTLAGLGLYVSHNKGANGK